MSNANDASAPVQKPASAPPAGGGDEKASQHGKRAALIAAVLAALVIGGLLVDAIATSRKAPPEAEAKRPPAPATPDPFADFEAREKAEQARIEEERRRNRETDQLAREAAWRSPQSRAGGDDPPAGPNAEQQLREAARLEDLKRALGALQSKDMAIGVARGAAPAPVANSEPSVATGDSGLARLRQAIERLRGQSATEDTGFRFTRDLNASDAATSVVGQSASVRRERGEGQRRGEFLIPVGSVMSAMLDMEINSDWEGRWRALITRDVYDQAGNYILIPKGSRVVGMAARAKVVNEALNERMALNAQWLVLPNGARIDLSRTGMLDPSGVGAIAGDVNHHFLATMGGVVAYGLIGGAGAAAAVRSMGTVEIDGFTQTAAARTAGAELVAGLVDVGKRVAARYLTLVPTVTIKPGTPMTIFLDDEMYLQPWAPIDEFSPRLPASGPAR